MPIIHAKNLGKCYTNGEVETHALKDASFEISKGEFVSIMGPSGSGKSTLLHLLGFLENQTSGEYFFEGKKIDDYEPEELARIRNKKMGFVFQAFNLLPRTSVFENVKLPLVYSKVPEREWDARVRKAIEAVGMTHRISHEPSQLSGGEKQRAAIARALVTEPEIIFADEPSGNLDSKSEKVIMEFLQKLNKEKGHTVVVITHENEVAKYADRIIFMRDGEIESDKSTPRTGSAI